MTTQSVTPHLAPTALDKWLTPQGLMRIGAGYVLAFIAYGFLVAWRFDEVTSAGLFGDMFGAFNALVSGIAMLGVIAAILLQREQNRMQAEELKLQRQELADTREELKGQRAALEAQNTDRARTRWQQNKPVVFLGRDEDGYRMLHNVGGGFAINTFVLLRLKDGKQEVKSFGALGSGAEQKLVSSHPWLDTATDASHIVIAEGVATRTRRWNPTLNWLTPAGSVGHSLPRLAKKDLDPRSGRSLLHNAGLSISEFIEANQDSLFTALEEERRRQ